MQIKERVAELRRQRKAEEEAWKNKIAEINARAQARPLLIEHDAQVRMNRTFCCPITIVSFL